MRFSFRKKPETSPLDENSLVQILVRLGKLSPIAIAAALASETLPTDDALVQALIERRTLSTKDVEVAREVQVKRRDGQPVYEEWAKLQALMAENKRCAEELTTAIVQKKDRRRRRGEDTILFLTPRQLRTAT